MRAFRFGVRRLPEFTETFRSLFSAHDTDKVVQLVEGRGGGRPGWSLIWRMYQVISQPLCESEASLCDVSRFPTGSAAVMVHVPVKVTSETRLEKVVPVGRGGNGSCLNASLRKRRKVNTASYDLNI